METGTKETGAFVTVKDESLLNSLPANTSMVVFCGAKELTISLFDRDKNKYLLLESFHYAHHNEIEDIIPYLNNLLDKDPMFSPKLRMVTLVVDTARYTLVPDTLYESFKREDYLSFNHEIPKGETVDGFSLRTRGLVILYSFPAMLRQMLVRKFPAVKVLPSVAGLLESGFLMYRNKTGKNILVNVKQQSFDLMIMEENKLLFLNTFPYKTSEDFLYYLLFTCEQLGLNTETMDLQVSGEIDKKSGLVRLIEKYVRNVAFVKRPDGFEYSYKFSDIPSHFFFNVFSQQLCV